jgi:hypothetical protein
VNLEKEEDNRLDSNDDFINSEACKELLVLRNKPTSLFTLMIQDNWD